MHIVKPKSEVPKSKVPKSRPKGLGLKKVLKVKVAQNDPLDSPSQKIDQSDSEIKDVGYSYM